jgi:DNA-binding response OmpR family regulator
MKSSYQKINGPDYLKELQWNAERHIIVVRNRIIPLTEIQYQLLFPLGSGTPLTYTELAARVYQSLPDKQIRMLMDKHIDRIRRKLLGTGIYVYCVIGYGYILLPEVTR